MSSFENMFRWIFYYDTNTSPEKYFGITPQREKVLGLATTCTNSQIQKSHFKLSLGAFLKSFEANIIAAGKLNNIDARAIAGAISWEYEENFWPEISFDGINKGGRMSDWFQAHIDIGDGIGWGSIHTEPARKAASELWPKEDGYSKDELICLRLDAESAIQMVGKIMGNNAKEYFKNSGSIWINDNPVVLAYFFNVGNVIKKAKDRKLKNHEHGPVVLDVLLNDMAKWVNVNLDRFKNFKTTPHTPNNFFLRVKEK